MIKIRALVCGLVMVSAVSAEPQKADLEDKEKRQRQLFAEFDENGNGVLTKKEFVAEIVDQLFTEFDLNKDGKVTKSEFLTHALDKKKAKQEFPLMDREQKGFLRKKDVYRYKKLIESFEREFAKLDLKGKGYIRFSDLPDLSPDH